MLRSFNVLFLSVFLLVFCAKIEAKGRSGHYYLTGYALLKNGDTLKNTLLTINFRGRTDSVYTDNQGHYTYKVMWATACPSGITEWQRARKTKRMNPSELLFHANDLKASTENRWRTFLSAEWSRTDEPIEKCNLLFH